MTSTQIRLAIGAAAAALVAVVMYLLSQGVLTTELATAASAIIAFVAGYLTPKTAP